MNDTDRAVRLLVYQYFVDVGRPPTIPGEHRIEAYVIDLNFLQVQDEKQRKNFLSMITSFFLPTQDVDALIKAGRDVLINHAEFQRLVDDLDGQLPSFAENLALGTKGG